MTSYLVTKHLMNKKKNENATIFDSIQPVVNNEADEKAQAYKNRKVDQTNEITGIMIDDSQSAKEDPSRLGKS
jgi:hypothetical protein